MSCLRNVCAVMVVLGLSGCAHVYVVPPVQRELVTPSLTKGQLAELKKREQTAAALGVQMARNGGGMVLMGVNEVVATNSVTVPLVTVPTADPFEEGWKYRVPVVLATINGREDIRLMLDSGSNQNLCSYKLAVKLRLPVVAEMEKVTSYGFGGAVEDRVALTPRLRIGELELRKVVTLVGPEVQVLRLQQFWTTEPVFLMGVNAFSKLSYLSVDYLRGTVTFGVGEAYRPDSRSRFATEVPLTWEGGLPCVEIKLSDKGPFKCVIDTGGDYGLVVPQKRATELRYWSAGRGEVKESHGVAGVGLDTRYNVGRAQIGGAVFEAVPARTVLNGPEPAGGMVLVGNVVLRRYRITFDFKNGKFWIERPFVGGRE